MMGKRYFNKGGYEMKPLGPSEDRARKHLMHRLVMENYLGGEIPVGYEVHHINMIRDDNRIENLLLMSKENHELILRYIQRNQTVAEETLIEECRAYARRLKLDYEDKRKNQTQNTVTRKRA